MPGYLEEGGEREGLWDRLRQPCRHLERSRQSCGSCSQPGTAAVICSTLVYAPHERYFFCLSTLKRDRSEKDCGTDCGNRAGTWKNHSCRAGVVRNQARPPSSVPLLYMLLMNVIPEQRFPLKGSNCGKEKEATLKQKRERAPRARGWIHWCDCFVCFVLSKQ